MEEKQRSTTSETGKLGRHDHLLPLPPSAWATAFPRLFSQVHIVLLVLHLFFWAHLKVPEHPRESPGSVTPPG